jgi:transcription elongation factor Elf1
LAGFGATWFARAKRPAQTAVIESKITPREKALPRLSRMEILCPHCGHAELDAFELIEVNELHDDFVCANCEQVFAACIRNCIRCDFEQTLAWRVDSVPAPISALPCAQCGHIELQPDALDDE